MPPIDSRLNKYKERFVFLENLRKTSMCSHKLCNVLGISFPHADDVEPENKNKKNLYCSKWNSNEPLALSI